MKRCKHENVDHYGLDANRFPFTPAPHEKLVCVDCGHRLSLGPATITDHVRIEMWAAESQDDMDRMRLFDFAWNDPPDCMCVWCEAMWLAEAIARHGET